jgi:hypothetical protein
MCGVGTALLLAIAVAQSPPPARVPVVIELFSSEGCSSCPPADLVLAALDQKQLFGGIQVLALEEHVDYWNHLGWRDPFSSPRFTERQNDLDTGSNAQAYTPQLWVDGAEEINGAEGELVARTIAKAALEEKGRVTVAVDVSDVTATVGRLPRGKSGTAFLAITERGLSTAVRRGENAGRTVEHGPVVRRLVELGKVPAVGGTLRAPLELAPGWNRDRLRVVVFVQQSNGRIVAAGDCGVGR